MSAGGQRCLCHGCVGDNETGRVQTQVIEGKKMEGDLTKKKCGRAVFGGGGGGLMQEWSTRFGRCILLRYAVFTGRCGKKNGGGGIKCQKNVLLQKNNVVRLCTQLLKSATDLCRGVSRSFYFTQSRP